MPDPANEPTDQARSQRDAASHPNVAVRPEGERLVRLFSAVRPPDSVIAHLAEAIERLRGLGGLRWTSVESWHITLAFYGDDHPGRRAAWLRDRIADHPAPRLRLAGVGTFPNVLWIGVEAQPAAVFTRLAEAAGADHGRYRPHLTLARARVATDSEQAAHHLKSGGLAGYAGAWFVPTEVELLRSEQRPAGRTYHTIERLTLAPRDRG